MKFARFVPGILGILFALFTGYQSFVIASAGAVNEIPQLEGDGGGGLTLSVICMLAAILSFIKPVWSIPFFILSTLVCLITGYIYEDNLIYIWAAGTVALTVLSYVLHRLLRNKKPQKTRMPI
jgi:hypothetical protein